MLTDEYPMEFAASDHHISITAPLAMICEDDEEARAEAAARHLVNGEYPSYWLMVTYRDFCDETQVCAEPTGMCSSGLYDKRDGTYFTESESCDAYEDHSILIRAERGAVTVWCCC